MWIKRRRMPVLIVAQYGVLERAQGCNHRVNSVNIVKALSRVTRRVVHVGVGIRMHEKVDGKYISLVDEHLTTSSNPFQFLHRYESSVVDNHLEKVCRDRNSSFCDKSFWRKDYYRKNIRNALRCMFIERQLSDLLLAEKFADAMVIAYSADVAINHPLAESDLISAFERPDVIFTTMNNDGDGFTNGFYLGRAHTVAQVLRGLDSLAVMRDSGLVGTDFERIVQQMFHLHGLHRHIMTGFGRKLHDMVKLRASGDIMGKLHCRTKALINKKTCPEVADAECWDDNT